MMSYDQDDDDDEDHDHGNDHDDDDEIKYKDLFSTLPFIDSDLDSIQNPKAMHSQCSFSLSLSPDRNAYLAPHRSSHRITVFSD